MRLIAVIVLLHGINHTDEGILIVVVSAIVGLVLMLAQALLGGVTVLTELPGWIVATHFAVGSAGR